MRVEHQGRGIFNLESLVRIAVETGILEVSREGEILVGGELLEMTHTPSPRKNRAPESITS